MPVKCKPKAYVPYNYRECVLKEKLWHRAPFQSAKWAWGIKMIVRYNSNILMVKYIREGYIRKIQAIFIYIFALQEKYLYDSLKIRYYYFL